MSTPVCTSFSRRVTRKLLLHLLLLCTLIVRSLRPIDIEFMSRLHTRVNLIPVIAKADTMTDEEIADFKTRVRSPRVGFVANILSF